MTSSSSLSLLHPERPIQSSTDDKLERSRFVERLMSALVNHNTTTATGIVVGITGPWGSGKSSILNLLREHIKARYKEAIVVCFDPWLVSGRDDLIAEFLGELIGTINADGKRAKKFKRLGATIAQYASQLSPVGNLWWPGFGAVLSGSFNAAEKALSHKKSLSTLRNELMKELDQLSAPIIVLIDEIDRIEDDEIRAVAQLVRSVADFPGISYVLAYDSERVIQALASGFSPKDRKERGRNYLEKIVQLQIPLPVTFGDEIIRLMENDLRALQIDIQLPDGFENIARYQELTKILAGDVLNTLRDIRRLIGTFHVLAGMLRGEVDWIDLLAYCALLVKAPITVEMMRREPDDFLDDLLSVRSVERHVKREKESSGDHLNSLIHQSEKNDGTRRLLEFLFSSRVKNSAGDPERTDALCLRRPLLTTLRLGLLPGAFSRTDIETLLRSSSEDIQMRLQEVYIDGYFSQLVDRLNDLYVEILPLDHVSFWKGVAAFAKKHDCEWMTSYNPMHEVVQSLAEILEKAVRKSEDLRSTATVIFSNLRNSGESELTAHWLRTHIFEHGLFGRRRPSIPSWFLNKEQTEAMVQESAVGWRSEHLSGKLIPCRWDLHPVFTMVDADLWDELCRKTLDDALAEERTLDGFSLMLFGGHYITDAPMVQKICIFDTYIARVKRRLEAAKGDSLHETARRAHKKALGER